MDKITFQDLIGKTDLRTPALQPILLAGIVLEVGIEVKLRAHGVAQPLQRAEFEATVVEATQQQRVAPRLGIVGDDLDDFEAVVDPKLLTFLIVVDGEPGIVLIGAEDQVTGGRQGCRAGWFRRRMAIRSGGLNRNHRLGRCHQRGWHRSDPPGKQAGSFSVWHSPR